MKIFGSEFMNKMCFISIGSLFLFLLIPINIYAQDEQIGSRKITTKYEEFVSQSGTFVKFIDNNMPTNVDLYNDGIYGKVRTFWGQAKNHYYLILTKKELGGSYDAMIEFSDLIELNKAFARLLSEVDDDVKLRTEYNYLENKYVTNDRFKLGYYIEKRKAKWFVKFAPNIPSFRITYQKEFCKLLKDAQEKIEQIMAREGK